MHTQACCHSPRAEVRSHAALYLVLLALTVVRALLAYELPLFTDLLLPYDDYLFYSYARSITDIGWVASAYSASATVKTPGYGIFLAGCHALSLRPQLAVALLQIVAAFAAIRAVAPLVSSRRIRALGYLFLIYAPILLTREFGQRVYRNCLAIPLILVLFASYIAMYLRVGDPVQKLIPWGIAAALSLGAFSVVNESAAWTLPFVLVCSLVTLVLSCTDRGRRQRTPHVVAVLVVLAIPLLTSMGMRQYVRSQNSSRFGVSLTSDKYEGEFGRFSSDVVHVSSDVDDQRVWVSNDVLEKVLAASPTLNGIRPQVEKQWADWTGISSVEVDGETQMSGDMPFWAFMESYRDAGGYKDGPTTQAFWRRVSQELETAFDNGTLDRRGGIYLSSTMRPIRPDQIIPWSATTAAIDALYLWDNNLPDRLVWASNRPRVGNGPVEDQEAARDYLGGNTLIGDDSGKPVEDECLQHSAIWLDITHYLGICLVWVSRLLFVATIPAAVYLLALDAKRHKRDGVRCGLVVLGCLLSAFVLTFAVSWMISFDTDLAVSSIASRAFCYLGPVYILWNYVEVVVVGRACCLLASERRAKRTARHLEL